MFQTVLLIIASLANAILGGILIFSRRKVINNSHRYFAIATISVGLWGGATIMLNEYTTMLWEDLLFIFSTSAIFFISLYSSEFVEKFNKLIFGLYLFTYISIILLLIFSDLLVNSVTKSDDLAGITVGLGPLFPLYIIFAIISVGSMIYNLARGYQKAEGIKKQQIRYIYLGIAGFVIPTIITNLILPTFKIYTFNNLGVIFSLVFTISVYTSIIRHRLFSIRSILIKTIKYIVIGAILFLITLSIRLFKERLLKLGMYEFPSLFIDFCAAIIIGSVITRIIAALDSRLTKFINPEIYNLSLLIRQIDQDVNKVLDLNTVFKKLTLLLSKGYPSNSFYFVILNNNRFEIYPKKLNKTFREIDLLTQVKGTIIGQELPLKKEPFISQNPEIEVIAKVGNGIWMICAKKAYEESLTKEELDIIDLIIEKLKDIFVRVQIYQTTKEFNEILENKVASATTELKEKNKKLAEKIEFEKDMLDILGHELRTPLSIVRNAVYFNKQLLKTPNPEINKVMKYNDMAVEHVTREITLLETMLSATKIDNNRLQLTMSKVDFIDVVQDSLDGLSNKAKEKGLNIVFNKPNECFVFADRTRIQEVSDNLIDNAIKYTDKGSVTIDIVPSQGSSIFRVTDTGRGIPQDDISKLGQKFYRVDNYINGSSKSTNRIVRPGGTGLGLYVTMSLIKEMGGTISVSSKVGEGTMFEVALKNYS